MEDNSHRLFCWKPFTYLTVQNVSRGAPAYLCCPSWVPYPVGTVCDHGFREVWNGRAARDIRRSVLDGSFATCTRLCPFLESRTGPVGPVAQVTDPALRWVIDNGLTELPWGPRTLNAAWDRSCNLACPSCRSGHVQQSASRAAIVAIQRRVESGELADLRELVIAGSGDPFGSPSYSKWISEMELAKLPALERIHLHTNAILWTQARWDRIPVRVRALIRSAEISIDAASPATYALNRRGGSFAQLLANLVLVSRLRREGSLSYLKLSFVVQANNYREMPAFVTLGGLFAADTVFFSRLVDWGSFSREELVRRMVHEPGHPDHDHFLRVLCDPSLRDPRVELGNLSECLPAASRQVMRVADVETAGRPMNY